MKTPLDNDLNKVYEAFNQEHDHLRESLMASLPDSTKQHKRAGRISHALAFTGGTIMRSRITKIAAAAAVIIIAVLVGVYHFSGSLDVSAVALGKTRDNMKKMLWLHQVAKGVIEGKEVVVEAWISFDLEVFATKQSDGHIEYYDYIEHKGYFYDPCSHTISISHVGKDDYSPFQGITSPTSFLDAAIQTLTEEGGKLSEKTDTYDGNVVKVYEISFSEHPAFKNTHLKFFVDPKQNLVIGEHVKGTDENGNILIDAQIKLDYPEKGPGSIYDIGVSSSARIAGAEKAKTAFGKAFEKAITIIDNRENWPDPRALAVAYWEARAAKNYDEMAIFWPGSAIWNRQVLENEEAIEYVFGEAQAAEIEGHIIVPYATKSHYEKHGKYSLKMRLENKKSTEGRYYIVSGN